MKKHCTLIHNQQGFLLFHVVWVILIVFLCLHYLLYQYQTAKVVADNQLSDIEVETLFQMAYKKVSGEIDVKEISLPYEASYKFPQGEAKVTFQAKRNERIYIIYEVSHTGNDHIYQFAKYAP